MSRDTCKCDRVTSPAPDSLFCLLIFPLFPPSFPLSFPPSSTTTTTTTSTHSLYSLYSSISCILIPNPPPLRFSLWFPNLDIASFYSLHSLPHPLEFVRAVQGLSPSQ